MTGPSTLLGRAADAHKISPAGLSKMTVMAWKLRNGWIPNDEAELNDVLCMMPGWESIATTIAQAAADNGRLAHDIIKALLDVKNGDEATKADRDAREWLGRSA